VPARFAVDLTASAERDVAEIFDFIAREAPGAARAWLDRFERCVGLLERIPRRASAIPEAEDLGVRYRHLLLGVYRVIFRIEGRRVLILRVIHGARLLDLSILEE
jgi:plasmid stabilization system protein ParE